MSLLVVGSVAFDAIETPLGKVTAAAGRRGDVFRAGGERVYAGAAGRRGGRRFQRKPMKLFCGPACIDFAGLERANGKTFFWAGRYNQNMNERTTLQTDLNVFAAFNPKLPASYRRFALCIFWRISIRRCKVRC